MINVVMVGCDNNLTQAHLIDLEGGASRSREVLPSGVVEGQQLGIGAPLNMFNPDGYTLSAPPSGGPPIGTDNKDVPSLADDMSAWARPILRADGMRGVTHPAVGQQFGPTGHSGAFAPFGDVNEDNQLTNLDFQAFRAAYDDATPTTRTRSIFDVDGDALIDIDPDFYVFQEGYTGINADLNENGTPDLEDILTGILEDANNNGLPDAYEAQIPAISSWGVGLMTLLTLTAGTLIFRNQHGCEPGQGG